MNQFNNYFFGLVEHVCRVVIIPPQNEALPDGAGTWITMGCVKYSMDFSGSCKGW